ncbi:MAG: hypothetical protein JST86_16125 [Bacteroidetes bacterium]|nr:hypothetical protein [Bacteroidota bacterium]
MSFASQIRFGLKNPALKSVGVYTFTNFFAKGVSFILIPIFTNPKFLSPADNGMLSIFSSNMALLAPFVSLGMIQSSTADFYKKPKDEFAASFTSSFILSFIISIIAGIVFFLFRDTLEHKFGFQTSFIYIIPALAFLVFSGEQLVALIRNRNEVNRFAAVGMSRSVTEYAVSVVLIVFFLSGWTGRVWGIGISLLGVNLFALSYYIKNKYINFQFRKSHFIEELKYGVPILVFQLCVFMLGNSNKLFLAMFDVDKHRLGIYSIACVLGSMIGVVSQSVLLYAQPNLYQSISSGRATIQTVKKDFFRYFLLLTGLSMACVLVVLIAYNFAIDKVYLGGVKYFLITASASYLWGLNYFIFLFLLYHKEKRKILTIALISLICSATVNLLMVKYFSILGDALSSLINTVIFSALIIIFARKLIIKTLTPENMT